MRTLTRRTFLASASIVAGGGMLTPRRFIGQTTSLPDVLVKGRAGAATSKIHTQLLRRNVSALSGSGGNIAVLPGKDGQMIVDSGYSTSQPQLTEALRAISSDPMTLLINTHWHFDHTDGNEWMHQAGATIMATENTKQRLSTTQTIAAFKAIIPPSPAAAIPAKTFSAEQTLHSNDEEVLLVPYAPAHTDTGSTASIPSSTTRAAAASTA